MSALALPWWARPWIPIALLASGCSPLSKEIEDPAAGGNGGFEITRSGLPVNWIVYSPATIPSGSYELIFDRDDSKEGAQSLKFLVDECESDGGWRSPGIAQEVRADPGATYVIRFWIKSEGCDWAVSYGGVSAKSGESKVLRSADMPAGAWHPVERTYTVPPQHDRIRFELGITSPGSLWIDDVRIELLDDVGADRR